MSWVFLIAQIAAFGCASTHVAEGRSKGAQVETKEQRDARMAWWREAKFGMFIHWGVYSVPAGTWNGERIGGIGEWIMNRAKIPVKDYAALTARFNPVTFDADEWVRLARDAGMKYIVITSKHHDGFAMFHSKASAFNIVDATPFGRDPLAELSKACRKHGLKLGFYYSQAQDWHHPGGAAAGGHWDSLQDGDMGQYIRTVAAEQVREILSNYGRIAVLWWDTPVGMSREYAELLAPLLDLQPGIITNNRLGGGFAGDTETPEQFIPATGIAGRDWETCMTMNDTWGFKSYDHNWKSTTSLIQNLVDIVSKGGNYLLNVSPTAEGTIPRPSIARLSEIGMWLKANGEAIYGSQASPFRRLPWGRCTAKPGRLYLHVFEWPDGSLPVPGLRNTVKQAWLLASPDTALPIRKDGDSYLIDVPSQAPDRMISVIVLEIQGEPDVDNAIRQAADGTVLLQATDATVHGKSARYETGGGKDNIGYWTDPKDWVSWEFALGKPGMFTVHITYACDPGTGGSEYILTVGDHELSGKIEGTSSWTDFVTKELGRVNLAAAGHQTLSVKPNTMPGSAVMNLKSVTLTPKP